MQKDIASSFAAMGMAADAYVREKCVDVARDKKPDPHASPRFNRRLLPRVATLTRKSGECINRARPSAAWYWKSRALG
jgi:hypothetical protein